MGITTAMPLPSIAMRAAESHGGFRIGQTVRHARFGEGVVVSFEGAGADARVQVNFGRQGVKWLMLSIAKLIAA